jgi:hypothetical protein
VFRVVLSGSGLTFAIGDSSGIPCLAAVHAAGEADLQRGIARAG